MKKVKDPTGKEKEYWKAENEKKLEFTCWDAEHVFGLTIPRFRRGIEELFEYGFLDSIRRGGTRWRQKALYGLSQRWRKYGTDEFILYRPPDYKRPKIGPSEREK